MTPEAQRIAIADACGMVWCRIGTDEKPYRMLCWCNPACTSADMTEPICNPAYMWEHGDVPDYLNDLNAMHEAEKTLTKEQQRSFALILQGRQMGGMDYLAQDFRAIHATAAQRAEAFLRTIGKWEDAP